MAGMDKDFNGEAFVAEGATVGYLPQEPALDENLTVFENVMMGLKEIKSVVDRFNEVSSQFANEMTDDEMNKLIEEQGSFKSRLMLWTPGILIEKLKLRWMHFVARQVMRM